jgi:hypothetical protein
MTSGVIEDESAAISHNRWKRKMQGLEPVKFWVKFWYTRGPKCEEMNFCSFGIQVGQCLPDQAC